MDNLKVNSVNSFRAWQAAGKPKHGILQSEMQQHRLRYRKAIRDRETKIIVEVSNSLHDALIKKNSEVFWKTWKSKFNNSNKTISVDGLNNNLDIANKFAEFFQNASESNCLKKDVEFTAKFKNAIDDYKQKHLADDIYIKWMFVW